MKVAHLMLRVANLSASIDFYCNLFGMKLLRKKDYQTGKFTLAFVGFENQDFCIELTYNWGDQHYEQGTGFGHVAIVTPKLYELCEKTKNLGYTVSRAPGPMKGGSREIAFIKDPDGYSIELIQEEFER